MAAIRAVALTDEIALSAATAKTVIQITAPSNQRVVVKEWGVFFDGIDPLAQPVQVELAKQSTAGTMSSLTLAKITPGSETVQTTASHTATAEPTESAVLDTVEVHPQSGYEKIFPLGEEIIVAGGERLGIVCTAPAAVNVRAKIKFEE
jgi:hypothetical protein